MQGTRFGLALVNGALHLTAAHGASVLTSPLTVRSVAVENSLQAEGDADAAAERVPQVNKLLNYFHSTCERFPLDDALSAVSLKGVSGHSARVVSLHMCGGAHCLAHCIACHGAHAIKVHNWSHITSLVSWWLVWQQSVFKHLLHMLRYQTPSLWDQDSGETRNAGDQETGESLAEYVRDLLEDVLHETTRKPHGKHVSLEPVPQASAADALAAALARAAPAPLGGWVRRAMCLVPLQISRCNGNTLEPMHDGEPRRDVVDNDDIVELSKQLRWGLYECLLNSHTGPVVVICALGQQSVGKSYQLNHLGGVFFDVAGGRCTDGVWLGARPFIDSTGQERLALFLDCEGIGSLERTETEDMLHCLLAGAISSMTMFKTHYAFNTCANTSLQDVFMRPLL